LLSARSGKPFTIMDTSGTAQAAEAEGDFSAFMSGLEDQVKQMMAKSYTAPKDASEAFAAFSAAVNWQQTWLRLLLAFHVFNFLFFVVTRNNIDAQTGQFVSIVVLVALSERLNSWCSAHWSEFADQDYFDKHGAFTGILFAGPLLLVLLFQLINLLRLSCTMLIKAKKLELKDRHRKNVAATAAGTGAGAGAGAAAAVGDGDGKKKD